jgi:hypothetical protein
MSMPKKDADSIKTAFERTHQRKSAIRVVLITSSGVPDTLGASRGVLMRRRDSTTICLLDQGVENPRHPVISGETATAQSRSNRAETYTAVELSSERSIRISEIRWFAGQRYGVP